MRLLYVVSKGQSAILSCWLTVLHYNGPVVYLNNSYAKKKSVIMLTSLGTTQNHVKLFHKESLLRAGFPGQLEGILLDIT